MPRTAESVEKEFKQRAQACVTKLRYMGQKAKTCIDRRIAVNSDPSAQYIATTILSKDEIMSHAYRFSEFSKFDTYLDQNPMCPHGVVHHNRTAVLINGRVSSGSVHGEKRLFDENVWGEMLKNFRTDCPDSETGVVLLFSFNIPCTIAGYDCARLLHNFAEQTKLRLVVGYDKVHEDTDETKSLNLLKTANIVVFQNCFTEVTVVDEFMNDLDEYQECAAERIRKKQKQKLQCRKLTKQVQANWSKLRREKWEEM